MNQTKTYMLWLQLDTTKNNTVEKEMLEMIKYAELKYKTVKNIILPKSLTLGDMFGEYMLAYKQNCPPQHFMLEIEPKVNIYD